MGISSDAILAYGVPLSDENWENPYPWDKENDEGERLYEEFDEWVRETILGYTFEQWYALSHDEREKIAFPLVLVTHCHYEYPMHFLAIRETVGRASRGYPVKVTRHMEETIDGTFLRQFLRDHSIEPEDEPDWYIMSLMG